MRKEQHVPMSVGHSLLWQNMWVSHFGGKDVFEVTISRFKSKGQRRMRNPRTACIMKLGSRECVVVLSPFPFLSHLCPNNMVQPTLRVNLPPFINHTQMCFTNGLGTSKSNQLGNQDQLQRNWKLHFNKEKTYLNFKIFTYHPSV